MKSLFILGLLVIAFADQFLQNFVLFFNFADVLFEVRGKTSVGIIPYPDGEE